MDLARNLNFFYFSTSVTCIADAIPNATIKWYKNGYEIFDNDVYRAQLSGGGISKLYITPTKSIYDERMLIVYIKKN